jgi:hypothetical protein
MREIWFVTTEGDNAGMATELFASECEARDHLAELLASFGVTRARDGEKLPHASIEEMIELWEEATDGGCLFGSRTFQ